VLIRNISIVDASYPWELGREGRILIEGWGIKIGWEKKELKRASEISCLGPRFKLSRFSWGDSRVRSEKPTYTVLVARGKNGCSTVPKISPGAVFAERVYKNSWNNEYLRRTQYLNHLPPVP